MGTLTKKTFFYLGLSALAAFFFMLNGTTEFAARIFAYVSSCLLIPYWFRSAMQTANFKLVATGVLILFNVALLWMTEGLDKGFYSYFLVVAIVTAISVLLDKIMPGVQK